MTKHNPHTIVDTNPCLSLPYNYNNLMYGVNIIKL